MGNIFSQDDNNGYDPGTIRGISHAEDFIKYHDACSLTLVRAQYGSYKGHGVLCQTIHQREAAWYHELRTWRYAVSLLHMSPAINKASGMYMFWRTIIYRACSLPEIDDTIFDLLSDLQSKRLIHNSLDSMASLHYDGIRGHVVLANFDRMYRVDANQVFTFVDLVTILSMLLNGAEYLTKAGELLYDREIMRQIMWYGYIHNEAFGQKLRPFNEALYDPDYDCMLDDFPWKYVLPFDVLRRKGVSGFPYSEKYKGRAFPQEAFESPETFDLLGFAKRVLLANKKKPTKPTDELVTPLLQHSDM